MPRARIPSYRRHKSSGQAIVTLGGRMIYLGPWGTKVSKAEYDRVVGEWIVAGRPDRMTDDADMITVAEVINRYRKWCDSYYVKDGKPSSEVAAIRDSLKPFRKLYGAKPMVDVGPLAMKAMQRHLIDQGLTRRGVNFRIDRIKRLYKWAVSEELIPANCYQAVRAVSGLKAGRTVAPDNPPVQPVADAVVEQTLPHMPEIVADMVRLQRLTGARPGEICQITPGAVDTSGDVWTFRPPSHKTSHHGRSRTILIGPRGQDVLRKYLLRPADAPCFDPSETAKKTRARRSAQRVTPLSCGNRPGSVPPKPDPKRQPGDAYTKDSYRRAVHRACELAGVEKWSPNRLRHSCATQLRAVAGIDVASTVLGHSGLEVTEVYAERDLKVAAEVMKKIG